LDSNAKKFHVIAQYFGRGLFSDLNQPLSDANFDL
jgi:hypothetical protein